MALADIKAFSRKYSQMTAASDWPRLFLHPRCFCLALYYAMNENETVVENNYSNFIRIRDASVTSLVGNCVML